MGRRARGPPGPPPNQEDVLRGLAALAAPAPEPQDRVRHAGRMREVKAKYAKDNVEASMEKQADAHDEDMRVVAAAGGLHVSQRGRANIGKTVHPRAWSAMQILRSAFVPASGSATAAVLECGNTAPRDARSVTAGAILDRQQKGLLYLLFDKHLIKTQSLFDSLHIPPNDFVII